MPPNFQELDMIISGFLGKVDSTFFLWFQLFGRHCLKNATFECKNKAYFPPIPSPLPPSLGLIFQAQMPHAKNSTRKLGKLIDHRIFPCKLASSNGPWKATLIFLSCPGVIWIVLFGRTRSLPGALLNRLTAQVNKTPAPRTDVSLSYLAQ